MLRDFKLLGIGTVRAAFPPETQRDFTKQLCQQRARRRTFVALTFFVRRWPRRATLICRRSNASGGTGAVRRKARNGSR